MHESTILGEEPRDLETQSFFGKVANNDIEVRLNSTFTDEDLADVETGSVVYPRQAVRLESGTILIASGAKLMDIDAEGNVTPIRC